MTEYICKEVQTNNGGYLEPVKELIRCKDCKRFERYTTAPKKYQHDGFCQWWARDTYLDDWCCGAERKDE